MFTVLDSLNTALHTALASNPQVLFLGEDILDPYGGAFKVSRGLSSAYPDRVLSTPISEAGFTGIATGMALRGLRPVVEIMFGDFVTLIADQLINHATKFRWMYGGNKSPQEQISVPMVIRAPMGGRRGYGPTHSQSLEKLFLGVPGLRVLAPTAFGDPGKLLLNAILNTSDPVLFIENKLLYLLPVRDTTLIDEFELREIVLEQENPAWYAPTYIMTVRGAPEPALTIAAYGYMAELVRQAALRLAYQHEVFIEIVVPTQLSPFAISSVTQSASKTGRLLSVEESSHSLGWGAEVLALTAETLRARLRATGRVAALDLPVPSSPALEEMILPGVDQIVYSALKILQK